MIAEFHFADEASRLAAEAAVETVEKGDRGAFIVCGPPRCGKTTFVEELLGKFESCRPATEVAMRAAIVRGIECGHLLIDDVAFQLVRGSRPRKVSFVGQTELLHFVSCDRYEYRKSRSAEIVAVQNKVVIFMTTCLPANELPKDVKRRFLVIELLQSEEGVAKDFSKLALQAQDVAVRSAASALKCADEQWKSCAYELPDADLTVLGHFTGEGQSEPVWPCFYDGDGHWRDTDGIAFTGEPGTQNAPPIHWRHFPEAPRA